MSSYNCEGMDGPIYIRKEEKFYPLEGCRGNCLDCVGEKCSIDNKLKGKDLTLKDYKKWNNGKPKEGEEQLTFFN